MYVPNREFWEEANRVFNPRNAMMIDKNDGKFSNDFNLFKDVLINLNGLIQLSRPKYSEEQLARIKAVKEKWGN